MPTSNKIIRLIMAAGEHSADLRYAAGFSTPDEFIWFSDGTVTGVVMSALEFDRARAAGREGVGVFSEAELGGPERLNIFRGLARLCHTAEFEVPGDFPLRWADRMRGDGMTVRPVDGTFFPEREFKSRSEVSRIVRAQRAAEAGLNRAFEVLRASDIGPGDELYWQDAVLTSEILRGEIDAAMLKLGMLPTGTICAGGAQAAQPHNRGDGPLKAHSPIVMDIFPQSGDDGYWGDLTRTVVRGRPSDVVKRAYDAVLAARELGKSLVVKGASGAEIHHAAARLMEARGFATGRSESADYGFFHGLGHGVGLEIHESPRLSPRGASVLRGGEVVTVEPGLYYPEWGGIRLEDLMYLPADGPAECLTAAPDFLTVE